MQFFILQLKIYPVIMLLSYLNYYSNKSNNKFNEKHYKDAYEFISTSEKIDTDVEIVHEKNNSDFTKSEFFVYDSLVFIDEIKKINKDVDFHEPIYSPELEKIFSSQKGLYDIYENKNIKWIIFFSKEIDGFLFANVIRITSLNFTWPDYISEKEKEEMFTKTAQDVYCYKNIIRRYHVTSSNVFVFKICNNDKIEYLNNYHVQY